MRGLVLRALLLCAVSVGGASGAGELEVPRVRLARLRRLVAGYHVNRELFANYGQTLGALQNTANVLLARSAELQASAEDAIELAKAKIGLINTEELTPAEKAKLDEREQRLSVEIESMASSIGPKLQRAADGLQSIIDTRVLFFEHGDQEAAETRMRHLLSYTYHMHGARFSDRYREGVSRLLAAFEHHSAEVRVGEPENDITSGALYDPNNTVFSRHPEFLRHNAHTAVAHNTFTEIDVAQEERVAEDAKRLRADFDKFINELQSYLQLNASQMYFSGASPDRKDETAKKLEAVARQLNDARAGNEQAVRRLMEAVPSRRGYAENL